MFRLAFLVAVVFALFGARFTGMVSCATTSAGDPADAALDADDQMDPRAAGDTGSPVLVEPEFPSDDDVATRQEERTVRRETAFAADPTTGFGLGPSQSHARPMEHPPRA
jgi:hypothetical protein